MPPPSNARALVVAGASGALIACSAIVSHLEEQCATDADCAKFAGTACVAGWCVAPEARVDANAPDVAAPDTCATTDDCLRRHGEDWACRHADGTCQSLRSTDCPTVLGPYTNDDAVILGAMVPIYGEHASTGAGMIDALRLAVTDFAGSAAAPSSATPLRPLAVVVCNESNGVGRPAAHLIEDLLVPAIVGTADGASTLDLVNQSALPAGVLVMTPRATTPVLSGGPNTLVWRTCATDAIEGAALTAVTERVLQDVATQNSLATVRAAVVHARDVTSTELVAALKAQLVIGGHPADATSLLDVDYGNPDALTGSEPSATYATAIAAVRSASPPPDVVVLVGSTQAVTHVLPGVDATWPGPHPLRWVLSSGAQTTELLALAKTNDDLRQRVVGTAPGGNDANGAGFQQRYRQTFSDGTAPEAFGVAQTYDALYALAFASSTTTKVTPVGKDLSTALARLLRVTDASAPAPIAIGPTGILAALDAIGASRPLALDGASGPLAFDVATGNVTTDVQVWCVAPGAARFESTGVAYLASMSALSGSTLACP